MSGVPTMHVLGLDVSLRSTGWAALSYEDGALIDCGVITSKVTDAYAETLLDILTDDPTWVRWSSSYTEMVISRMLW